MVVVRGNIGIIWGYSFIGTGVPVKGLGFARKE